MVDKVFDIPSKIIHIPKGKDITKHLPAIRNHFQSLGSPIMMGGDQDASSKGVFGVTSSYGHVTSISIGEARFH